MKKRSDVSISRLILLPLFFAAVGVCPAPSLYCAQEMDRELILAMEEVKAEMRENGEAAAPPPVIESAPGSEIELSIEEADTAPDTCAR